MWAATALSTSSTSPAIADRLVLSLQANKWALRALKALNLKPISPSTPEADGGTPSQGTPEVQSLPDARSPFFFSPWAFPPISLVKVALRTPSCPEQRGFYKLYEPRSIYFCSLWSIASIWCKCRCDAKRPRGELRSHVSAGAEGALCRADGGPRGR